MVNKAIVNRIRHLLKRIVGPAQSSFIRGRQTSDNIIITYEIIHMLEKKRGKEGGIIFKIDLEKAYNRISWGFLEKCLEFFDFDKKKWIKLVMRCVTQGETSILWNGEPLQAREGLDKVTLSPCTYLSFALNTFLT